MHTLHEAVKVGARLALERQRIEKSVDQISLAAANTTPEIQAFHRFLLFLAEQLAEQAGLTAVVSNQVVIQTLQMPHGSFLGGIVKKSGRFRSS